ncbi:MAG: M56 family metallopeptidase [Gemmatimonadaceae bacterium]|nr:M56 family metallopeptidase [Gemmatimonadaceae bacterium]
MSSTLLMTPADSARAVGEVYGVSLLATVPIVLAIGVMLAMRGASAGARVLLWRAAIVAVLVTALGRLVPFHWMAWVVPEGLASPLIALGTAQLAVGTSGVRDGASWLVPGLAALYVCGVVAVLTPLVVSRVRLVRLLARAASLRDAGWQQPFGAALAASGVRGDVQLVMSTGVRVPMTWGWRRPVVVVPVAAVEWGEAQRRAALLHELMHVRGRDAVFTVLARVACALLWFHPGVWWLSAQLAEDVELACDDRVLLGGVRRSDYAELLVTALDGHGIPAGAAALVRRSGLRARLQAIADTTRVVRVPSRRASLVAIAATIAVAVPVATVRVAPTREVLTSLMRDVRWESRAYAVVRLAQRRDSVEVARAAADRDPSPRVRAWAHYALARGVDLTAPVAKPTFN